MDEEKIAAIRGLISDVEERPARVAETLQDWRRNASIRRILHRLGLVSGMEATERNLDRVEEVLGLLADGEDANTISARLLEYADRYGSVAVCVTVPRCAECNLTVHCRYYSKTPTLKHLPEDARPRERLLSRGAESLSDADLLGILISSGTGGENAIDLANRLLAKYGSLRAISQRAVQELCEIQGIGPAKAARIGAGLAIARRMAAAPFKPGEKFTNSAQVFDHFHYRVCDVQQEMFFCLTLDTKNCLIQENEVSRGGLDSSAVNPRDVFAPAIREKASAVIFVHNHPSGDPSPSPEDRNLTRRLKEAGQLLGLRVLDHVVIGKDRYFSFADQGMM